MIRYNSLPYKKRMKYMDCWRKLSVKRKVEAKNQTKNNFEFFGLLKLIDIIVIPIHFYIMLFFILTDLILTTP